MIKFEQAIKDIITQLEKVNYSTGDLGDIGNEIGIAIGKYVIEEAKKDDDLGVDSFIQGLLHGISLIDGTH